MAIFFSSLYGANPSNPANFIYKGPHPTAGGLLCVRQCTFIGTMSFAATDSLRLCRLTAGERITGFANSRLADPDALNDFIVNIGTTTTPTLIAAANTGMQGIVKLVFDAGDLAGIAAAVRGDDLIVAATAGAAEVSTTHFFTIYSHVPNM